MILRLKPSAPAILVQNGLHCYFCNKPLMTGILTKPMSGASWACLSCWERHEKNKADRKAFKKASISEAILKKGQKQQDYYNEKPNFTVPNVRGEGKEDLF